MKFLKRAKAIKHDIDYDDSDYLLFDNVQDDFIYHGKHFYNLDLGDAYDKLFENNDDLLWNSLFINKF